MVLSSDFCHSLACRYITPILSLLVVFLVYLSGYYYQVREANQKAATNCTSPNISHYGKDETMKTVKRSMAHGLGYREIGIDGSQEDF